MHSNLKELTLQRVIRVIKGNPLTASCQCIHIAPTVKSKMHAFGGLDCVSNMNCSQLGSLRFTIFVNHVLGQCVNHVPLDRILTPTEATLALRAQLHFRNKNLARDIDPVDIDILIQKLSH